MFIGHHAAAFAGKRASSRIGSVVIAQRLFVPWAWWIDRHRQARA